MFQSFFTTIFRVSSAVLCAVTTPPADLRSLSSYYYAVCGRMCMSSVCFWFSRLLVITNRQEHQTHTDDIHMRPHTKVIIRTQRMQISGRNSNGTKHSGGHPEDCRVKIPKHVGVLYLQTRF